MLDIDKLTKEQLEQAKDKILQSEFTHASFISPSGNGIKVLVKVNTIIEQHKEIFAKLKEHYENLVQISIDKSGSDITRLCFYSYDENLYYNTSSTIFVISSETKQSLETIEKTNVSNSLLTTNDYLLTYNHCVKFTEKKVQFTNGSRNVFVHQLACNLNRKAVPIQVALGYILADYNFNDNEVTQAVNSAYGNISEYGIKAETDTLSNATINQNGEIKNIDEEDDENKPKPTIIDKLENFLLSKYSFRHNIVSSKLEFQQKKNGFHSSPLGRSGGVWHTMNDFIENSMLRECLKARVKTNLSSLRNLLYSDFCPLYNPFEAYFESLTEYDEKEDYITALANTITTTKQELWQQCFKKWLVAMVGCVLNDKIINHTVIVFSGKQGIGKTTWVEKLVPKQLKDYLFSGTINPNNKDTLIHLAECMLINLDELENLNRSEIGSLKEIITKTQIRMRRAYGHNNETMPRRASFAGSVNTAQFLNDTTGSRRFLCFEVESIQYQHNININIVYAQAYHLYQNEFKFWFDQEEIKAITDNNEQYQLRSPEEELLLTWFEPCTKETANYFLNASQICAKLAEKTKLNITDGSINKIGKALKKHKFIRLMRKGSPVYALKEFTWEEVELKNTNIEPPTSPSMPPEQGDLPF